MDRPLATQFQYLRDVDGELIILDDQHAVAHQLTVEAATVWRACDGRTDLAAIAGRTGITTARVEELVSELDELALLTPGSHTRRSVLRKAVIGGAAVAGASAITSVLVPSAAQAFESAPGSASETFSASSQDGGSPTTGSSTSPSVQRPSASGPQRRTRRRPGQQVRGSRSREPVVAGANDGLGSGGGGATGHLPTGSLPFTGTDLARIAAVGGGLIAAGAAARSFAGPPPEA